MGFVYENTAYGTSTAGGLKETAAKEGYKTGLFEAYDAKFTDASPLVNKIKASGVEVIFPVSYTTDAELIISTMQAMRVNPMLIGGGAGFIWPDIYKSLGDKINGVFSVGSWSWDSKNIMSDRLPEIGGRAVPETVWDLHAGTGRRTLRHGLDAERGAGKSQVHGFQEGQRSPGDHGDHQRALPPSCSRERSSLTRPAGTSMSIPP